jgi:UDP-N-acetyl-D-glucosamine dehydrogenase
MKGVPLSAENLKAADCVIITTAHRSVDYDFVVKSSRAIFDTRNVLKGRSGDHIFRL